MERHEDDKEQDDSPPPVIDPFPILGDILNHIENIALRNAEFSISVIRWAIKNETATPEIITAADRLRDAYEDMNKFKMKILEMVTADGKER